MSLGLDALPEEARGFPRVSGDEPHGCEHADDGLEFSPRERG